MTNSEKDMLILIRNAIRPKEIKIPLYNPVDWDEILTISARQNLFSFVYDEGSKYPEFEEFEENNPEIFVSAAASMGAQMRNTDSFLNLYRSFISEGIEPIVLKGIICRELYGDKGNFRLSGDEDILIRKENYNKAAEILEAQGYRKENGRDENLETIQEITFYDENAGFVIELHINLFGTTDNLRLRMNDLFQNVYENSRTVDIDGVQIRAMNPTDQILFLILHAFKHFCNSGFGIRMVLDIMLYVEKYSSDINWDYIKDALKKTHADRFYADLMILSKRYFGFTESCEKSPTCPNDMLEDIMRMGTFGNISHQDALSGVFTQSAIQRRWSNPETIAGDNLLMKPDGGQLKKILRVIFPSWKMWTAKKPYLKKQPWMLPIEWVKRASHYMKGNKDEDSISDLSKSYMVAERRIELLKKYKVI